MALAASGIPSVILEKFEALIAGVAAFRTWTGAADAAAAKAFIAESKKDFAESDDKSSARPFAVINVPEWHQVGDTGVFAGTVELMAEADIDAAYADDPDQALREFNNNWSAVIQGMITNSREDTTGTVLNTIHWGGEEISDPEFSDEDEEATDGQYIWSYATFQWGLRGDGRG